MAAPANASGESQAASSGLVEVSSAKCFSGLQKVFSHESTSTKCKMNFAIYLPPAAVESPSHGGHARTQRFPVLFWLSGLTCSEQNFIVKSGYQRYAARHGLIVVAPDTSPRGCNVPGESDRWDFGVGAGFYVDATQAPFDKNWHMYTYVTKELPELIHANFPTLGPKHQGISGHSMGGHGALICALKNPDMYRSVSAFSPISNPSECEWGRRAFTGYLGDDQEVWKDWDACHLVRKYNGPPMSVLIDQGDADQYLHDELKPFNFVSACSATGALDVSLRLQEGYDHSYFFVGTFIGDHFEYHARLTKSEHQEPQAANEPTKQ